MEDADAVCAKALAAGATLIDAPRDQEYGERSASVKDPAGNITGTSPRTSPKNKGESYIAKGLNNVNVYMHPLRAEPVIGFLKARIWSDGAFEIRVARRRSAPRGNSRGRFGDGNGASPPRRGAQGKYPPMPTMFYMYVPDCDAVYRRALAAGGNVYLRTRGSTLRRS